jgi:hypothetical protein
MVHAARIQCQQLQVVNLLLLRGSIGAGCRNVSVCGHLMAMIVPWEFFTNKDDLAEKISRNIFLALNHRRKKVLTW